jgi:ribonuclease P protein component
MLGESKQRLGFNRAVRIKQGRDFARTRNEGQRTALGCMVANWRTLETGATSRLGVITSKKIGNAVARSRARRLLREAFRLHQLEFEKPVDFVMVARPSIAQKGFADVEKDFLTIIRKAGLSRKAS